MSAFNGSTLMITGGTGFFGHTVLKHFLSTDFVFNLAGINRPKNTEEFR